MHGFASRDVSEVCCKLRSIIEAFRGAQEGLHLISRRWRPRLDFYRKFWIIACGTAMVAALMTSLAAHAMPRHKNHLAAVARSVDANGNAVKVIGGRPLGCPHAYCGCGLARYLGFHDRRLNLAWNWARLFPHTSPHSGAAAVRHGHVMLLQERIVGLLWQVIDFNGGRHLSWIHERDVRGCVFVEPGLVRSPRSLPRGPTDPSHNERIGGST